jgi:hypothetical protein
MEPEGSLPHSQYVIKLHTHTQVNLWVFLKNRIQQVIAARDVEHTSTERVYQIDAIELTRLHYTISFLKFFRVI